MPTNKIESQELIENDYRLVKLQTTHQENIDCRYYYASKDAKKAVIYVGGVGGGLDSPARELISATTYGLFFYLQNTSEQDIRNSIIKKELQNQPKDIQALSRHIGTDLTLVVDNLHGLANSIYI